MIIQYPVIDEKYKFNQKSKTVMKHKSYYEHQREEKENAVSTLNALKAQKADKVSIFIQDKANTVYTVHRNKLEQTINRLKKRGDIIKRIL